MPVKPVRGEPKNLSNKVETWQVLTEIINEYKQGRLTNPPDTSGEIQSGVMVAVNRTDLNQLGGGTLMQLDNTSGSEHVDVILPTVGMVEPEWHDKIDNLIPLQQAVIGKRGATQIEPSDWAPIALFSASDTDEDKKLKTWVMPDPEEPRYGKLAASGMWKVLAHVSPGRVIVDLRRSQNIWVYEFTEGWKADGTKAKLYDIEDELFADEATIQDPQELMSDQGSGDKGFCRNVGNKFYAMEANC